MFAVLSIFLILISIYFIRAYAAKKQSTAQITAIEANLIENTFKSDIGYSEYFLKILVKQIEKKYDDLNFIASLFQKHFSHNEISLGWRKYSWIDSNFNERVTSSGGITKHPKKLSYIENSLKENPQSRLSFFVSKAYDKNHSLKLIYGLRDKNKGKYKGSLILSYDIPILIKRLEAGKRKNYVNFVILNEKAEIVAGSKQSIEGVIDGNGLLSEKILKSFYKINFKKDKSKEISYLNMVTGGNYYLRKISGLPFALVVNLTEKEIKSDILNSVTKKFIEVAIFTSIFLFIVVSIYRRESWLRAKAEKATIAANMATKAKSDFLSYTAHEIRSPLGFVTTGSEIMAKELLGPLPSVYKEYAEGIHQSAKSILEFITDILDETQIIEGKFNIVNSTVDIEEIIKKAIKINKTRFAERKVEINYRPPDHPLPLLVCDSRRLLQVFGNVISNSVKYSKDGSTVSVRSYLNKEKLEVEVIDDGIGMSEEEVRKILSGAAPSFKKRDDFIESYGIGLSIVKMLLKAHDADLLIKSEPGAGTCVTMVFHKHRIIYAKKLK